MKVGWTFPSIVTACMSVAASMFAAQPTLTTPEMLGLCSAPFTGGPFTESDAEAVAKQWLELGFTQQDRFTYAKRDNHGALRFMVFASQGSVYCSFTPAVASEIGDAALAALLHRAQVCVLPMVTQSKSGSRHSHSPPAAQPEQPMKRSRSASRAERGFERACQFAGTAERHLTRQLHRTPTAALLCFESLVSPRRGRRR